MLEERPSKIRKHDVESAVSQLAALNLEDKATEQEKKVFRLVHSGAKEPSHSQLQAIKEKKPTALPRDARKANSQVCFNYCDNFPGRKQA